MLPSQIHIKFGNVLEKHNVSFFHPKSHDLTCTNPSANSYLFSFSDKKTRDFDYNLINSSYD